MRTLTVFAGAASALVSLLTTTACTNQVAAQAISTFQFRHVAPDKAGEFIRRETTYWSKVAKKGIDNGNLTFWGLFEKVGGTDLQSAPNFLFLNTYNNIDSGWAVWDASKVFPKIPISQMEDGAISKTTGEVYLSDKGWQQAANVVEEKDFNYLVIYYHNTSNPDSFTNAEIKTWGPFIKTAMDKNQTAQRGWGNSVVLAPIGSDMKYNSISYDLFPTLQDALLVKWDPAVQFPTDGMTELDKLRTSAPNREIYRVIMVVNKPPVK